MRKHKKGKESGIGQRKVELDLPCIDNLQKDRINRVAVNLQVENWQDNWRANPSQYIHNLFWNIYVITS